MVGTSKSQALLVAILERIGNTLRSVDQVCQPEVDCLWLYLPDLADPSLSFLAASKLIRTLSPAIETGGYNLQLNPLAAVVTLPALGLSAEAVLELANSTLATAARYEQRFAIADLAPALARRDMQQWEAELAQALDQHKLEVHYQPQVNASDGHCHACEALVRWHHHGEAIPAGKIVDIAESAELIVQLTLFVMRIVVRDITRFVAAGHPLSISLNVSSTMLGDDFFAQHIFDTLELWDAPPHLLTIEVTEGTIIKDVPRAQAFFAAMKARGVSLSIDDFGIGYSSLAYLRTFPITELKIDQLFVRNMLDNNADDAIVRTIITLAHNFGLIAVAEGVESAAIAKQLRELGCDLLQGFHFSPALPFDEACVWLGRIALSLREA